MTLQDDLHPEDAALEAALRAQPPYALPAALVGRIRDQAIAPRPLRPLAVVARVAAAVLVVFAAWFAVSGDTPALADAAPQPRVVAVLPPGLPHAALPDASTAPAAWSATTLSPAATDQQAIGFLVAGALVLLAGLVTATWLARKAPEHTS